MKCGKKKCRIDIEILLTKLNEAAYIRTSTDTHARSPTWMESFVYLKRPLNTLHQAKKDRQSQNQDSNPESVPLHPVPPVVPPLRERSRMCLIKDLFQNDKAVVPERKVFDLAVARSQMTTFYHPRIQRGRRVNFLKPLLRSGVGLGEEEGKRSQGLLDEPVREHGAAPISPW